MQLVNFPTLNFAEKFAICWGFFWRAIAITIGSMIAGGLLGGVFGFLAALVGLPRTAGPIGGAALGLTAGLYFFYLYVRWLLSSKLSRFRLQLVVAE